MIAPSGTLSKVLAAAVILTLVGCASSRYTARTLRSPAIPETKPRAEKHPAAKWLDYQETTLFHTEGANAYFFIVKCASVDADGAPNAYHPKDKGIDALANAGYPKKEWWPDVLVTDPANPNRPFVQRHGEFAGYFVSRTALQDPTKLETDPARYVDARNVPYFVFPGSFYALKGTGELGDIGIAINLDSHESSAFIVADLGPSNAALGEVSIGLAERLGGKNVNPRTGDGLPKGRVLYLVFPHSKAEPSWPLTEAAIQEKAAKLLESAGGWEVILPLGTR